MKRKHLYSTIALSLSLAAVAAWAGGPPSWSIPFTFSANTAAKATEVNANFAALEAQIVYLRDQNTSLQSQLSAIQGSSVMALDPFLNLVDVPDTVTPSITYPTIQFVGANVQIVNGTGATGITNGLGNLIVGYNESYSTQGKFCSDGAYNTEPVCTSNGFTWAADQRSGSHDLILGQYNAYTQFGGLAAGRFSVINGPFASVLAGRGNQAGGEYASVVGGLFNTARGENASVSGGYGNRASGDTASVSGGYGNSASGKYASVSGGWSNSAEGLYSSVSGGASNQATGKAASVSGGGEDPDKSLVNVASGDYSSVSGGVKNVASGKYASVSGGYWNSATGNQSSISGGFFGDASVGNSSISGGSHNKAQGKESTVGGGYNITTTTTNEWCAGSNSHCY